MRLIGAGCHCSECGRARHLTGTTEKSYHEGTKDTKKHEETRRKPPEKFLKLDVRFGARYPQVSGN
jgi:hypothetical protein